MKRYKRLEEALREVEVTFSDGSKLETNMAAHLTDEEIKDYYKVGSSLIQVQLKIKWLK